MLKEFVFTACACLFFILFAQAQGVSVEWTNPMEHNAIQGRVQTFSESNYHRLPGFLENEVRAPVWRLGKQAAGLYIDLETEADTLYIRYGVKGNFDMPHMPATGVSGVDLYAFDQENQKWAWAPGKYRFADTVSYFYHDFARKGKHSFRLYLPLYNEVTWLEIGVPSKNTLVYTPRQKENPIIVYGTSIAQGACATRPGMAWTNILHRELNYPLVNLGFSGNGKLEQPILDLIKDQKPAMVVLDCLPNLSARNEKEAEELSKLIDNAIQTIRAEHKGVPILIAEHSTGFNSQFLYHTFQENAEKLTKVARERVDAHRRSGDQNLYLLPNMGFEMDEDVTVDYVHPNDIGMRKIAEAYKDIIFKILGAEK